MSEYNEAIKTVMKAMMGDYPEEYKKEAENKNEAQDLYKHLHGTLNGISPARILAAYDEVSENKLPTANDILDECKDKPKKAAGKPIIKIDQYGDPLSLTDRLANLQGHEALIKSHKYTKLIPPPRFNEKSNLSCAFGSCPAPGVRAHGSKGGKFYCKNHITEV